MPTYVYECSSCNNQFEVEQRMTEDPLNSCECGASGTVKRVIQPVGVMFKGSGFHINDYSASKPTDSESKNEVKTETTTESKGGGETSTGPGSEGGAGTTSSSSASESSASEKGSS
ncbi:MAG: hypothetical protein QOJ65_758 [Fimbriimonadaceae bacterium]|jgi:putative FmdB family regulatory protein|nr:hypothetical protein [Fimbriimonadaceae bacterium]